MGGGGIRWRSLFFNTAFPRKVEEYDDDDDLPSSSIRPICRVRENNSTFATPVTNNSKNQGTNHPRFWVGMLPPLPREDDDDDDATTGGDLPPFRRLLWLIFAGVVIPSTAAFEEEEEEGDTGTPLLLLLDLAAAAAAAAPRLAIMITLLYTCWCTALYCYCYRKIPVNSNNDVIDMRR